MTHDDGIDDWDVTSLVEKQVDKLGALDALQAAISTIENWISQGERWSRLQMDERVLGWDAEKNLRKLKVNLEIKYRFAVRRVRVGSKWVVLLVHLEQRKNLNGRRKKRFLKIAEKEADKWPPTDQ